MFRFRNHREVEILVRLALRRKVPGAEATSSDPPPENVELADYVIKCGLVYLGKEPFMFVLR